MTPGFSQQVKNIGQGCPRGGEDQSKECPSEAPKTGRNKNAPHQHTRNQPSSRLPNGSTHLNKCCILVNIRQCRHQFLDGFQLIFRRCSDRCKHIFYDLFGHARVSFRNKSIWLSRFRHLGFFLDFHDILVIFHVSFRLILGLTLKAIWCVFGSNFGALGGRKVATMTYKNDTEIGIDKSRFR